VNSYVYISCEGKGNLVLAVKAYGEWRYKVLFLITAVNGDEWSDLLIIIIIIIIIPRYGAGVDSASNRNEYQE
jgi:hypothetical protein